MPSVSTIIEIGATLVVVAGIVGAFWAGFTGKKSTNTSDANETIQLINEAKKALEDKINSQDLVIADQDKRLIAQEKRIKDLEAVNESYVKLFQGDPSRLESYMYETAKTMKEILDILAKLHPASATTVNITK